MIFVDRWQLSIDQFSIEFYSSVLLGRCLLNRGYFTTKMNIWAFEGSLLVSTGHFTIKLNVYGHSILAFTGRWLFNTGDH